MRVVILAAPCSGCEVWPMTSRDLKTVPAGSPPPIFSATRCKPSGVQLEPSTCPMPKRDVEHGYFFTNLPSSNNETLCVATLTVRTYFVGAMSSRWQVVKQGSGKVVLFMEWKLSQPENRAAALAIEMSRRQVIGYGLLSFLTSTLELRPLWSYFSRRAGGRSSGVPAANPPLAWK